MTTYAALALAALVVCALLTVYCLPSWVIAVRNRHLDELAQTAADFGESSPSKRGAA